MAEENSRLTVQLCEKNPSFPLFSDLKRLAVLRHFYSGLNEEELDFLKKNGNLKELLK